MTIQQDPFLRLWDLRGHEIDPILTDSKGRKLNCECGAHVAHATEHNSFQFTPRPMASGKSSALMRISISTRLCS